VDDKQVVRDAHHGAARVDGEREFAHHKVAEELVEGSRARFHDRDLYGTILENRVGKGLRVLCFFRKTSPVILVVLIILIFAIRGFA
jgi:hypothetical protein